MVMEASITLFLTTWKANGGQLLAEMGDSLSDEMVDLLRELIKSEPPE